MILKRDGLELEETTDGKVEIRDHECAIHVDRDGLRWLLIAGLPTILASPPVPSESSVRVRDASHDEGQIKGQLAIE